MLPFAYKPVKLKLEAMGGVAELRMAKSKAVRFHAVRPAVPACGGWCERFIGACSDG